MAPPVFHLDPLPAGGDAAILDGAEGRHAATVRRIRVGERVLLTDGRGGLADCTVTAAARDVLELVVARRSEVPAAEPRVTVVQALPKGERSELAVELATEAGADVIIPWQASRCVARWQGPKIDKGVQRWQGTAIQAAKQSRRAHFPQIGELHTSAQVAELIGATVADGGRALVLHESARAPLTSLTFAVPAVVLVVGPEGGIDDGELAMLTARGATAVHLGPTVLRTSTAAAVTLGALGALTARWAEPPFD